MAVETPRTAERRPRRRFRRLLKPLLIAGIPLLLAVGAYALASWPQSQIYGPIISHGPTDRPRIALTFDDGPNEPYTSQILDILDQKGVKATFFVVGANAEVFPLTLRREVAD